MKFGLRSRTCGTRMQILVTFPCSGFISIGPFCPGLFPADPAVWRNDNVSRDVFKTWKGHRQFIHSDVPWSHLNSVHVTRVLIENRVWPKDLKALYLKNVLRGDTSRASKFRVHVEAGFSTWSMLEYVGITLSTWGLRFFFGGPSASAAYGFLGSINYGWCIRAAGERGQSNWSSRSSQNSFWTLAGELQILDFSSGISRQWCWWSRHALPARHDMTFDSGFRSWALTTQDPPGAVHRLIPTRLAWECKKPAICCSVQSFSTNDGGFNKGARLARGGAMEGFWISSPLHLSAAVLADGSVFFVLFKRTGLLHVLLLCRN